MADSMEVMLADPNVADKLQKLAQKDKSLVKKILDYIKDFIKQFKALDAYKNASPETEEGRFVKEMGDSLDELQNLFADALASAGKASREAERVSAKSVSNESRFSYRGVLAKDADLTALDTAKQMLEDGASSEDVRKATGWFKGYDGKWRFEIDDSKSEFDKKAFGKFSDDKNTYIDIIANDETVLKYDVWRKLWDSGVNAIVKVEDVYKNDALFKAYPELKNITVDFKAFYDDSNYGSYNTEINRITLNYDLSNEKLRSVIAHELQHAVQVIEGFAEGGTPAMFVASEEEINIRKAYNQAKTADESKQVDIAKNAGFKSFEQLKKAYEDTLAYNKYRKIAGEIESWDVENRLNMTAEQRKNTRPDIDRTDVVFADGNGDSYDIGVLDNGNTYVIASRKIITATDVKGMRRQITNFFNTLLDKNGRIDITAVDGDVLTISKNETGNKARDNYKEVRGKRIKLTDNEFFIKTKVESHIDEIVETSLSNKQNSVPDTKGHSFAKDGFTYRTAYFEDFNGDYYKITFSVGNTNNIGTVYNVGKIKKDKLPSAKLVAVVRSKPLGNSSYADSILPSSEKVNNKNSVRDSEGKMLTKQQAEYFKNSKVRDADGNLLVVYHGTDAEFNVFDILKAGKNGRAEGFGFYFTDDTEISAKYGDNQKKVYLNITKPLYGDRVTLKKNEVIKFVSAVIDYEIKRDDADWRDSFISNYIYTYGGGSKATYIREFVDSVWENAESDQDLIYEIANGAGMNYDAESAKEFYDVLYNSIGVDGNIAVWEHADGESTVYVAFRPEQIKLTSNEKPTSDVDVRFSNRDTTFSKALTADEWKKYNNAITSGVDAGLRINDRSMLVECEKGDYSYKLVIYDNEFEDKPIKAVYGIAKSNKPTTNNNFDEKTIAEYITELEDRDYDNKRALERLLKSVSKNVGRVLGRYSGGSNGFVRYGREISQSGGNPQNQSDRGRISKTDTQSVKFSERGISLTASEENEVGKALYTLNKYAKKIRDFRQDVYNAGLSDESREFLRLIDFRLKVCYIFSGGG